MFTPESLLAIASEAEALYNERSIAFPAGTYDKDRNDARYRMEQALNCAAWMEACGHTQLSHVGPFGVVTFNRGARVRLRRGAHVFGTGSSMTREGIRLARAQVVTVHSVDAGYVDTEFSPIRGRESGAQSVRQPAVHWAGTGGYWRWTDITNIEAVD